MTYKIFSIFDCVDNSFDSQLFLQRSEKKALFNFLSTMEIHNKTVEKTGNGQTVNPADYRLYCVGSFDILTGSIIPCAPYVVSGSEKEC